MAGQGCSVTAREIADVLREDGSQIGLASIYRTLDLLDRTGLVQRFEVGEGSARYEPAYPSGEHHHHIVCDSCGDVVPFEDDGLEQAIERLAGPGRLRGQRPRRHAARRVPGLQRTRPPLKPSTMAAVSAASAPR